MMDSDLTALVVAASAEEFAHVEACLPDWKCVAVPLTEEGTGLSSIPTRTKLVIVYARKDKKGTLAICEELRNSPETAAAPILLVISRYLISQGNAVKRMGNADFIMTPFDEKEMHDKIAGCFGT